MRKLSGFLIGAAIALVVVAWVAGMPQKWVKLRALEGVSDRTLVARLVAEECFGFLQNGVLPFALYGSAIPPEQLSTIKTRDDDRPSGAMISVDKRYEAYWGATSDGTRFCSIQPLFDGERQMDFLVGPMLSFIPFMAGIFEQPNLLPDRSDLTTGPTTLGFYEVGKAQDAGLRVVFVVTGDPAARISAIVAAAPPR